MPNSRYSFAEDAAQVRVSARELTEALASIEVRAARLAFEQAGTVTLGEAAAECRIDAKPEELQAEIERLRAAEEAQQKGKLRRERLRLGLGAEIASAALCLLALLGLKHTLFDPSWRQTRQAENFQKMLSQTVGPHPKYEITVVPESGSFSTGTQPTIMTFGNWANRPAYPLYSVPEGYNIHSSEGLNDEGQSLLFVPSQTMYVEFREAPLTPAHTSTFVYYDGLLYRRGWVREEDVSNVFQGHPFNFYPCWVPSANCNPADLVPLTVSVQSLEAAHEQAAFTAGAAGQNYQEVSMIPDGSRLTLDTHTWEQYPGTP